ncbi:EpsG family protein [Chryseobacterium sp. FH1]|uniref:EpsG family protein n=1 Tax=Chryseobacterium sp. FH1 TaxID=1233951 RepID=UPI0004E2FB9F|nr:hypothetical protein IO90_12370 [Chryseobacterium sp. FH1]
MFPYLFVFAISIFSTYLAQISLNRKNKVLFFVFSAIAILTPSLLAGFRDSGVGTDTKIYVDSVWNQFKHIQSWGQFYKYYKNDAFADIEFVYLLLNFVGSRFGTDVHIIYFLTSFVIVLFVYLTAYDNRKKAYMWLVMFVFLFGFYNQSLNLVRQTICLTLCLYGFKYLEEKKWIKFILLLIVIKYTHNTGIFYFGFIGAYILAVSKYKAKHLVLFTTLTCCVFIFMYFDYIVGLFVVLGILPQKFLYYLSGDTINYVFVFIFHFAISMILLVALIFNIKSNEKDKLISYMFLNLLGSILILTALVSVWSFRVAFYFLFISECILLPRALFLMRKHKLEYSILILLVVSMFFTYWFTTIAYYNENETYPYKSEILE